MLSVLVLSLIIGLLLGLMGGGGSVMMVPMLVYWAELAPKPAIATSLLVVGITSLVALVTHARRGNVCWKMGAIFGVAGILGSYAGGRAAALVRGEVLLLLFAGFMLMAAVAMLRGGKPRVSLQPSKTSACPARIAVFAVLFDGLLVGGLTGLVGAGGGFLVVPALHLMAGLAIHVAVGTSLLIVGMSSLAAFAGYANHVPLDFQLVTMVTCAAVAGSLLGGAWSRRIDAGLLRRIFAGFVLAMAGLLIYKELTDVMIDQLCALFFQHEDFLWGVMTTAGVMAIARFRRRLQQPHRRETALPLDIPTGNA